jgi:hypothetical protein
LENSCPLIIILVCTFDFPNNADKTLGSHVDCPATFDTPEVPIGFKEDESKVFDQDEVFGCGQEESFGFDQPEGFSGGSFNQNQSAIAQQTTKSVMLRVIVIVSQLGV